MDCSLPGSSVHGILQARILEWDHYYYCSCLGYKYLHSSVALVPPKGGLCGIGVVLGPFRAQLFLPCDALVWVVYRLLSSVLVPS